MTHRACLSWTLDVWPLLGGTKELNCEVQLGKSGCNHYKITRWNKFKSGRENAHHHLGEFNNVWQWLFIGWSYYLIFSVCTGLEHRSHDVFLFDFTLRGGSTLLTEIFRNTQLVANGSMKNFSSNIWTLLTKSKKKILWKITRIKRLTKC